VASTKSTRQGTYHLPSLAPNAIGTYQYRIHAPARTVRSAGHTHRYPAWTSGPKTYAVHDQTISLQLPSTASPGNPVSGSVTVTPYWSSGRAITIQGRTGDGAWSNLAQVTQVNGPTPYLFTAPNPSPGEAPVTESVRAVAGDFHTVPSVTSSVQTLTVDPGPDYTPPPTPTGLSVVSGDQQITLTWTADTTSDLAGYTVYESAAHDGPWTKVNSTMITSNSYTVTGLTNNTMYFFSVSASNTSGAESAKSGYYATPVVYRSDWAQISAGVTHTCGLRTDGTVWCWGDTYPMWSEYPAQVGTDSDWISISSGYRSACALKADHSLWCWGDNDTGQLGDGTQISSQTPVQVGTHSDWATVSAGNLFTCGIRTDGTAWCWGSNQFDAVGDGAGSTSSDVPVQVGSDSDWASISAGFTLACGLHTDGSAWCWGSVADTRVPDGSLGDGKTLTSGEPIPVAPQLTWTSLATDGWGACGVLTDGDGSCWGQNWAGQLGTGSQDSGLVPTVLDPNHWGPAYTWLSVQGGGGGVTCGIRPNHTLWCWGGLPSVYSGGDHDIGNGTPSGSALPVQIGSNSDWTSVSGLGGGHTCALRSNGTAWCWGSNSQLALANNPLSDSLVPARVAG
jgi:alpha-tubulin suppressor-like RCC1 family protein